MMVTTIRTTTSCLYWRSFISFLLSLFSFQSFLILCSVFSLHTQSVHCEIPTQQIDQVNSLSLCIIHPRYLKYHNILSLCEMHYFILYQVFGMHEVLLTFLECKNKTTLIIQFTYRLSQSPRLKSTRSILSICFPLFLDVEHSMRSYAMQGQFIISGHVS